MILRHTILFNVLKIFIASCNFFGGWEGWHFENFIMSSSTACQSLVISNRSNKRECKLESCIGSITRFSANPTQPECCLGSDLSYFFFSLRSYLHDPSSSISLAIVTACNLLNFKIIQAILGQ